MLRIVKPTYVLFYVFCHLVAWVRVHALNWRSIYFEEGMRRLAWFELSALIFGLVMPVLSAPAYFWLLSIGMPEGGAVGAPVIAFLLMFLSFMTIMMVETFRMDNKFAQKVRIAEQKAVIKFALRFGNVEIIGDNLIGGGVELGSLSEPSSTRYGFEVQLPEKPVPDRLWGQRLEVASNYDLLIEPSAGKRVVLERMWLYILTRLSHPFTKPQEGLGGMFLQRGVEAKFLYGTFDMKTYSELAKAGMPLGEIARAYDPTFPLSMLTAMYEPVEYDWEDATSRKQSPSRWCLQVKRSRKVDA